MRKYWIAFLSSVATLTIVIFAYRSFKESGQQKVVLDSLISDSELVELNQTGKDTKSRAFKQLYTKTPLDSVYLPSVNGKFLKALEYQYALLKQQPQERDLGNLQIDVEQLEKVLDAFRSTKSPQELAAALDAYQICGADKRGNIKFTGYYSPVISVRHQRDAVYKYPFYLAKSKEDKDYTTVYVRDRKEIASMRIEGTAYIQYPSGDKKLVTFDGQYGTSEEEVENTDDETTKKVLTSNVVFTTKSVAAQPKPFGAAKTPITSDFTVAVDNDYIPLGSVLLAQIPIVDEKGNLIRHEYRFVLAQDTGSAIQGTGHVDLYMGEGEAAKVKASHLNKYGKLWLLMPKEQEKLVAQNLPVNQ